MVTASCVEYFGIFTARESENSEDRQVDHPNVPVLAIYLIRPRKTGHHAA